MIKVYASKILVLVSALILIYYFWGADIRNFLVDRGVVDFSSFILFVYNWILWLIEKIIWGVGCVIDYVLQVFNNILSNVNHILDLFLSLANLVKKIFS